MRVVRQLASCPSQYLNACIALGNFDGVHLGHQAILRTCTAYAWKHSIPSAVMTFEPHPREFFSRENEKLRLTPLRRKIELVAAAGVDVLFLVHFNQAFASLTASDFITQILHQKLQAQHIITGFNFGFGAKRSGNTSLLEQYASQLGFGYSALSPICGSEGTISSSAIRAALTEGHVQKANALLGRHYDIEGHIQHGEKRGRTIGFATANIHLRRLFKPRFGVYAVRMHCAGETLDAVANVGVKPTFGHSEPLLEVHALDVERDFYGKHARIEFIDFIRDEKRFDGIESLTTQLKQDCAQAKILLGKDIS